MGQNRRFQQRLGGVSFTLLSGLPSGGRPGLFRADFVAKVAAKKL
jgi:hypothetical protein